MRDWRWWVAGMHRPQLWPYLLSPAAKSPLQLSAPHASHWPGIPAMTVVSAAEPPSSRPVSKLRLAAAGLARKQAAAAQDVSTAGERSCGGDGCRGAPSCCGGTAKKVAAARWRGSEGEDGEARAQPCAP